MNDESTTRSTRTRIRPNVPPVVVRATDAHAIVGMGKTKFYEACKTEGFPRPLILGRQARGYVVRELEDWAASVAPRG